ncbi:glutaredoxin family protein [Leucobacter aridicollis]|uniref:Glutaredoxin n=1 Tax=Leucobacter aridicollis TaxID=283878 RepID=A0A852RMX8_9MICO|nr:glutaredoxin family protein [Leucobacter aridicollis]MBL3680994.1 glutaredoxin family protein [Leucobacter aridicollis]NYD28002.1 glutaredoxin [Leucobacter aridicollis]
MEPVRITLIGKPGCHLCDDARDVVERVRSELAADGVATELAELNILEDAELARLHSEDIPVVRIGDKRHAIWHVDAEKFETAVRRAAGSKKPFWRR